MNIIRCVAWRACEPLWLQWKDFHEDDPAPKKLNTALLYIDQECIKGKTPKRTIGFVKEIPGDETTMQNVIGCAIIHNKEVPGLRVGGVGNLVVDPLYRRNGIATQLMDVCMAYMFQAQFDISIVYATVPKLFEKYGYVILPHKDNNGKVMMYRPLKSLPTGYSLNALIGLSKKMGTW